MICSARSSRGMFKLKVKVHRIFLLESIRIALLSILKKINSNLTLLLFHEVKLFFCIFGNFQVPNCNFICLCLKYIFKPEISNCLVYSICAHYYTYISHNSYICKLPICNRYVKFLTFRLFKTHL